MRRKSTYIPRPWIEHGGVLTLKRRKSKRPLDIKRAVHVVLRSDLAVGKRSLKRNEKLVERVFDRFSRRFRIRVYQKAVCGNHIHCLVKAKTRKELQNFFRVLAGQIAQEILRRFPLQKFEKKAFRGGTHPKNQKTFWSLLLYSRLVGWGRDFGNVSRYVIQNVLETMGIIPYQERKSRFSERVESNTS
jgi:REP element-mobilizing transposase RayT